MSCPSGSAQPEQESRSEVASAKASAGSTEKAPVAWLLPRSRQLPFSGRRFTATFKKDTPEERTVYSPCEWKRFVPCFQKALGFGL